MKTRRIKSTWKSKPTIEGAGVRLKRAFGFNEVPRLDPFLLLDDFHSSDPEDYIKGFPWHPHRGIETITYVLEGRVEHGDSMGNTGEISSGDVQWMTAGSGIIHQEMPKGGAAGKLRGYQLWANLPASKKMMEPRYREVKSSTIPVAELPGGVKARVICGTIGATAGPVRDIVTEPEYLDISVPAGTVFNHRVKPGRRAFAYVIEGNGNFDESGRAAGEESLVLYEDEGESVTITADKDLRFLFVSGMPLDESVAWQGPIVMNTQEELRQAFEEYRNGTFIKGEAGR